MNSCSIASPHCKLEEASRIHTYKFTRIASKKINQHLWHIMKTSRNIKFFFKRAQFGSQQRQTAKVDMET